MAKTDLPAWRLNHSAAGSFFAIIDKWHVPLEKVGELLGDILRSSMYKLKATSGTLRQDELTRISYLVGIYKALHILLPVGQCGAPGSFRC